MECKIEITDSEIFTSLIKLCARMVNDKKVPEHYKCEIQGIIDEKDNFYFKHHPKVFYRCDKRACANGCNKYGDNRCNTTSDIRHAKNFQLNRNGSFVEQER